MDSNDYDDYGYDDDEEPLSEAGWYMHKCKCLCGHEFSVKWHEDIDCGVREACPKCGVIYDEDDRAHKEASAVLKALLADLHDDIQDTLRVIDELQKGVSK